MRLKLKNFTALMLNATILLSTISGAWAKVDEGMFTPDQIDKLPLKKKGLKIKSADLYNPNGVDISDAVIRLSIGCTGEFVSPKGLILTNHHCGYDALVSASTPEMNYAVEGFKADSQETEMPAKDYSIFITNRVEDVTDKIKKGTENLSGEAYTKAIQANVKSLQDAEQTKVPEGTTIRIQALNSGFFYYLYETVQIKDIRVVYAPHRNIGIYGGDPDNFEWSRHTGDFTFLRAYVAPDGKSVEYSKNNVPFKPKKHLTVSLDGVKENDFVFVMGYPGGTTRYRESQNIQYSADVNFPFLATYLRAWSDALNKVGETDEEKRVKLQGEIASIDNGRKLYEGGVVALKRSNFAGKRRAEEEKFTAWVNADAARKAKYGEVLANLDKVSKDFYAAGARDRLLRTFPQPTFAPVYKQVLDAVVAVKAGTKLDDKKREEIRETLKDHEPLLEREMLKYFLKAASELPANEKFAAAEEVFGKMSSSKRREAEEKFAKFIAESNDFNSPEDIFKLYEMSVSEWQSKYPELTKIAAAHAQERSGYAVRARSFNENIDRYRVLYQQGMAEMRGVRPYPDANSTLRFTYGYVRGYQPREAVIYQPFTSIIGMIEKETGVYPFEVPQRLKDLQKAQDFGRYGLGGSVPVNFLATTDIIGGNSGSPIMNAKGEQVGIIFDGNYEGLGNDIFYDENYGRSIAVDIRYVLFVTEKVAGAGWILNEMDIKGGAKNKK